MRTTKKLIEVALPLPDERAVLDRMPGSTVPVIRQPWDVGDGLPFWAWSSFDGNHLWDRVEDPSEDHDLAASGGTGDGGGLAAAGGIDGAAGAGLATGGGSKAPGIRVLRRRHQRSKTAL